MMLWVSAAQAGTVSPLPASDYTVQPVCAVPAPGHASCLAQLLVAETATARAHTHPLGIARSHAITAARASEGAYGLRPQDLRGAYFPGEAPDAPVSEPQTIALVDAYDDPNAEADLEVYDQEFSLPRCTEANRCFKEVNQGGETGHPPVAGSEREKEEADGWALETSLDIEMAHAVCQNCHVVLVEADNAENTSLEAAEDTAAEKIGATEISNSWGGEEPPADSAAFDHPGIVITVSAGDDGYLNWDASREEVEGGVKIGGVDYPASSPHVVAVGGTSLILSSPAETRSSETVWNNGGGGCSLGFEAQVWQSEVLDWSSVGCGTGSESKRAVADVAADADPYTGVAIYDSVPYVGPGGGQKNARVIGWTPIGGTSVASPIIASMFALAGGSHGVEYPAKTLYSHLGSASLYDVTEGGNGKCDDGYSSGCSGSMHPLSLTDCGQGTLICNSATGYDGPSGVGSPNGIEAFKPGILPPANPKEPETRPATNITSEAATLEGKLRAELGRTSWYFVYATGTSCTGTPAETTPAQEDTTLGEPDEVSAAIGALQPDTEYTACLVAKNSSGSTPGAEVTFTTLPATPPIVSTGTASGISEHAATLSATVDPQGLPSTYEFELGTGTGYGIPVFGLAGQGAVAETIAVSVLFLEPGVTYHYRIQASNVDGTSYGADQTFTTPTYPVLTFPPAIIPPPSKKKAAAPKAKALTRAQKLARALKACKRKRNPRKRAACIERSKRRYGASKTRSKRSAAAESPVGHGASSGSPSTCAFMAIMCARVAGQSGSGSASPASPISASPRMVDCPETMSGTSSARSACSGKKIGAAIAFRRPISSCAPAMYCSSSGSVRAPIASSISAANSGPL